MGLSNYFRILARYNRIANELLYERCTALSDEEYRKQRSGSFGSIHGLLNHLLLGDRIWMARFEGGGVETPGLSVILFDDFLELQSARVQEDVRIELFFRNIEDDFFSRSFSYLNNQGKPYVETAPVALGHFFNHQTHHRAQVHVMLSQTTVPPPSLDMHRIINNTVRPSRTNPA